jgi:glycosyltransferase involved in cell wall biosynthesis
VRIDQFLPSFASRDAIGSHVLNARKALREAGFESDIWAEEIRPPLQDEARPVEGYPGSGARADVIVYHASGHSRMAGFFAGRPEALVVDYHNITPSRFLARWDPVGAANVDLGRLELRRLAPVAALALADSGYNQAELVEAGFRRTAVSPILHDYDRSRSDPDPRALADLERRRQAGGARWLFVGRLAPNKCQHDVIGAFAVHRRLFDPNASLTLVGGTTAPRYDQALRGLIAELGVGDAVELVGSIPLDHLLAIYRTTDVLVCLSEHEGFCVPIVEAMALGVPVVAYAAAAVAETVGDAGLLLDNKDPLLVACAVERVVSDAPLRSELVSAGRARAQCFSLDRTAKELVGHLSALVI